MGTVTFNLLHTYWFIQSHSLPSVVRPPPPRPSSPSRVLVAPYSHLLYFSTTFHRAL